MGITAENVAKEYGITREMRMNWRYIHSVKRQPQLSPVLYSRNRPGKYCHPEENLRLQSDEFPKANSTAEALGALRPASIKQEQSPPGTRLVLTTVLPSGDYGRICGAGSRPYPPGSHKSYASGGVPPALMGMGPVPARKKRYNWRGCNWRILISLR